MRHRHPVALDVRAAHGGGVEQQVDEVVVQQVDLVDVEHAAVRLGEQPRLVGADALRQRPLQVQRPDEPVLGRADRQLDEPGGALLPADGEVGSNARQRPARAARAAAIAAPARREARRRMRAVRAARVRRGGSQEKRQPATTGTAGSSAASARTAVDLAVPFSPRTSTPPTPGCTALSSSASRRSSWPTTAENGKCPGNEECEGAGTGHGAEPARDEVTTGRYGAAP